ncbi:helix-turn-helix domain containing protein [Altererythrobacter arenosus]|uniref:Helix-turn-helix domain containing protein n=1 Tax=Altererythrobacter arenosus TaxID=3032592 RepID=A0ABY8FTS6_9SPHN|nr:TetR/AcrR family transcriptional regulator [Altererythrobacter sp. CAU 1644]WFL78398.1 helix-turn-helix domain containing protein [Altererythrobacter sp. CAU 1644]
MNPTRERLIDAAEELFASRGFAATSIAALERQAGLAPRTGGFYRHFESKQALAIAVARERIVERDEDFDPTRFLPLPDLRSELVLYARLYLEAAHRQRERHRLIEELRKIPELREGEIAANERLFAMLCDWVATKPRAAQLEQSELANLTMLAFGPILFLATKIREGITIESLDPDHFVDSWAEHARALLEESP